MFGRQWWGFVLRGIAAVLFGVVTFITPGMALVTLVFLFGAYALLEGALSIAAAIQKQQEPQQPRWMLVLEGVVSVLAGLLAFSVPGVTAISLLYLIGGWALVTGAFKVVAAIRLRHEIQGEWMLALSGVISVVLGLLLMVFPGAGALTVVLWIGAYAVVFGALLIALGVKLRSRTRPGGRGIGGLAPGHGHG